MLKKVESFILGMGILLITIITIANVISRWIFNKGLSFGEELGQFCIIAITFIGTSYAVSFDRHIRMSAFTDQMKGRFRLMWMTSLNAVTSLLLAALSFYAWQYVIIVKKLGTVSPALAVPFYMVYFIAPVGLVLSSIRYMGLAWSTYNGKAPPRPTSDPSEKPSIGIE